MGNAHIKPHPRLRNKKQVHWKAADRSAPPGKPELLPETEGTPDLVTLRWTRPINDGGSPISGYLVEHRRVGSPHWVRATPQPVPFPEITLSGLEPGWRYQFRVSAENAVGYSDPSDISEPITVTLHKSAVTAPKFTQEVNDTVALENEKCEFVAHFLGQPAPKVCWFKDGFEIFSSRRIRILTEHDRSVLTIHQTSLSDEGEIKCTATNRAGHISSKAKLTVEAPPSIRLPRNYEEGLLFELGEIIRLKVSVVGRPTPLVFWTHNGESLQSNDRYEIDYIDKSFSLKIADAQRTDRGEYQIKAVNKLGQDATSFLVTVTDKPSRPVPSIPGKARVMMTLGRSVTLSWSSPEDDGGCKIGNYIVEYYRLGWNVWLKAATSRQLTTRLGDLIEGSEYKFRIKAESPYGVSDPSEESDVIFIPDPKRGINNPPAKGKSQSKDFFKDSTSARSQSTSRVANLPSSTVDPAVPPTRPKRTRSKSQQQTPESSPMLQRKEVASQMNRNIFDRSSLARDMAYGSPDMKLAKEAKRNSISNTLDNRLELSKTKNSEPKVDHTFYKVKIESPKEVLQPVVVEPRLSMASPEGRKKLIREHSATVSGSSEFMLVLYSDENDQGQSNMFNFKDNPIPPPLSLSAPELSSLEALQFPPLKNSASSTELLHERSMMRFYEAAEAEERELEKIKYANSNRRLSHDIPKIQINSRESADIVGLDKRNSLRRKMSFENTGQPQSKWTQKRLSLKNTNELMGATLPNNLKKTPLSVDMKRELMMLNNQSTSEELTDQEFQQAKTTKKEYTQSSFEKRPVTSTEETKWKEEYEESLSESDSGSEADIERFKFEVNRSRRVHVDEGFNEDNTYRPAGGLGAMRKISNEPFEILNRPKNLPDPNFVPKPILKKTDSPSTSPAVSPPSSPIKIPRALSPRPDVILQRNRSKSLAVPALPPLISSSGDESDEPKKPRTRSLSLTGAQSRIFTKKIVSKPPKKSPSAMVLPSVSAVAQISGITAASIVIPNNLLDKRKDEEETRVVADHYDHIVKSIGQRRRSSNPFLNRDELKRAAEGLETPQEEGLPSKEQTPSKENLSQDSGYHSVSGYRRSSFTDHYDTMFKSPIRRPPEVEKPIIEKEVITSPLIKNSSPIKPPDFSNIVAKRNQSIFSEQTKDTLENTNLKQSHPRRDSGVGVQLGNFANPLHSQKPQTSNTQTPSGRPERPVSKGKRSVSRSKSPSKRGTSVSRKTVAMSPARSENWNTRPSSDYYNKAHKRSPSPMRKSKSPSPKRRPMLKEIMTQTSGILESVDILYPPSRTSRAGSVDNYLDLNLSKPGSIQQAQDEIFARANLNVRSYVDWLTDVAIFSLACWLYLFKNELLAIPVLFLMVYRQLKENIKNRIPTWLLRRLLKRPMLREIITRFTPDYVGSYLSLNMSTTGCDQQAQDELFDSADFNVRSDIDWLTDVAMFALACWLYLFKNELLVIPVLCIMIYRQLKKEINNRIPAWLMRRLQKKKTELDL